MTRLEENRFRLLPPRLSSNYPHYIISGNKLCKNVSSGLQDSVTVSQPQVLLVGVNSPKSLWNGVDPVTDLVVKKCRWRQELEKKLNGLRSRAVRRACVADTLHQFNKLLSHGKAGVLMSEQKVRLVKHMRRDPDAMFDGCCNWYFCGGQLNYLEIGGKVILTSVQGREFDSLYFVPLMDNGSWSAELAAATHVSPVRRKPIFQVVTAEPGYTVVRCRNQVTLYQVALEQDVIVGNKCFTASSQEPFVSVDVCTKHHVQVCSVHMDHNLCLWDVNTQSKIMEHVSSHCSPSTCERWSAAIFGASPHALYYCDRWCVRHFDVRAGLSKHVGCWCIKDCRVVNECESIFSMVPSAERTHSVYLGTTHHVLALDVRKHHGVASTESWTHMLRTPPLYGCCSRGDKQMLVMASQESSEVQVFGGGLLPAMLQSFPDCLRRENCRGGNLEPEVRQRFQLSVSGLTCVTRDGSKLPSVLVQTAAGDIFLHELNSSCEESLPDSCDLDTQLRRRKHCSDLKASSVWQVSYLRNALKEKADNVSLTKHERPGKGFKLNDKRFVWMKSKEQLLSYRDLLASSVVDAWDIDAMEEWKKKRKSTYDMDNIQPDLFKKVKQLWQEF